MHHADRRDAVAVDLPPPPTNLLRGASLLLDFDGTLVDLADTPDAIEIADDLPDLIALAAAALGGRVALVSGRPASEIVRFLGDDKTVAGSHGAELRWPDRDNAPIESPSWIGTAAERAMALAARHEGVMVEVKPLGVALHYRRAPDAADAVLALAEELSSPQIAVQPGKMVVELRARDIDKGHAVRAFMAEAPFAGSTPIFVGDDLTDEAGFAAAAALGGAGVLVGPSRETAASYRLDGVAATLAWIAAASEVPA